MSECDACNWLPPDGLRLIAIDSQPNQDLVEVNPGLDPPPTDGAMHGDDDALGKASPTVRLAAELALSALGKQIVGNVPPAAFKKLRPPGA